MDNIKAQFKLTENEQPEPNEYVLGYWKGEQNPYDVVRYDPELGQWLRSEDEDEFRPPDYWAYLNSAPCSDHEHCEGCSESV